jgi:hypothetical protein
VRPESFDSGLSEQWSRWVLDHGLPALPAALADGESVPVAWWTGPDSAAVLHLRRWPPADMRDLYGPDDTFTDVDVDVFARESSGWALAASGGSGGWSEATLARVEVADDHASLSGAVGGAFGHRQHLALWGEVGAAAATLEVEQDGVTTSHPVVAPLGWVVVSAAVGSPFTARVRDGAGRVLTEEVGSRTDW